MKDWRQVVISPATPILKAIEIIDAGALQIAFVVDEKRRLLGTVTDGDVRRAILKRIPLDNPVANIMNSNPTVVHKNKKRNEILKIMKMKGLRHIPVVDGNRCLVNVEVMEDLLRSGKIDNFVVLMAGGLGTRLRPLTRDCPKPLLKVGSKPILETILNNFIEYGFNNFFISVNYKAEMIEKYFGDGSSWGVRINYLYEDKRLGTAGALGLLPEKPELPIVVMNGDLLTRVNFQQLLAFHNENNVAATMCVREFEVQVPYGVVNIDQHRLKKIDEKPLHRFFVNAGIYVLDPVVLDLIPKETFFDMPELFDNLIKQKQETAVFPVREYWLDIGQLGDYERANGEYKNIFDVETLRNKSTM
ncbi:MAG: nucleotidyltransferase family protein [Bacillota bacterium]